MAAIDRFLCTMQVEQIDDGPRHGRGRPRATNITAIEKEAQRRLETGEALENRSEEARALARSMPAPRPGLRPASVESIRKMLHRLSQEQKAGQN